jgi:hypothetical protein
VKPLRCWIGYMPINRCAHISLRSLAQNPQGEEKKRYSRICGSNSERAEMSFVCKSLNLMPCWLNLELSVSLPPTTAHSKSRSSATRIKTVPVVEATARPLGTFLLSEAVSYEELQAATKLPRRNHLTSRRCRRGLPHGRKKTSIRTLPFATY